MSVRRCIGSDQCNLCRRFDVRQFIRLVASLTVVVMLTALLASTALAGGGGARGVSNLTVIDRTDEPAVAGQEFIVRFTLLAQRVPVDAGAVDVTVWQPGADQEMVVPATSVGGGEWVATLTLPVEGDWRMSISHAVLPTSHSSSFVVGAPPPLAWLPAALIVASFGLLAVAMVAVATLLARRPRASERLVVPQSAPPLPAG